MNVRERFWKKFGEVTARYHHGVKCSRCRDRVDRIYPVPDHFIPPGWKSWYVCAECLTDLKGGNSP